MSILSSRPNTVVYIQATSEVGGSDIALYRLVTRLDRKRYQPIVILPRVGPLCARFEAANIPIRILPVMQLRSVKNFNYQACYLARFWPSVYRLSRTLRRERADLVHSNSLYALYGGWAAAAAGVPHIWHIRELPDVPAIARRALALLALSLSARVIPMTNAVAEPFPSGARAAKKLTVLPDGIDLERFHPSVSGDRIRSELHISSDQPLIGFVGRLDPWKGADIFVRAAARVAERRPDARFIVCAGPLPGYEGYARDVKRLATELKIENRITFTEWRYQLEDIPEVMAALDVFVHTSIRPEPFGLVLVEAMASAKPVVAANDGGVPEVVDEGVTGLLAAAGDWLGTGDLILQLLDDPQRAKTLGEGGRMRAERLFEVSGYAARIQMLYDDVLAQRSNSTIA